MGHRSSFYLEEGYVSSFLRKSDKGYYLDIMQGSNSTTINFASKEQLIDVLVKIEKSLRGEYIE